MPWILLPALFLLAPPLGGGPAVAAAQSVQRACLSPSETLDAIADRALVEPRRMLRAAADKARAEAVGARLCRWEDAFVYEFTLLRQDGRILFVYVDASSGKVVDSPQGH